MTAIHVQASHGDTLANDGIAGLREATPEQAVTAIFRHPATGADLPVTITMFQDGALMGVGVYVDGEDGTPAMGTVLRWDSGPGADPKVIRWERPHCADDDCGSPCGHGRSS